MSNLNNNSQKSSSRLSPQTDEHTRQNSVEQRSSVGSDRIAHLIFSPIKEDNDDRPVNKNRFLMGGKKKKTTSIDALFGLEEKDDSRGNLVDGREVDLQDAKLELIEFCSGIVSIFGFFLAIMAVMSLE